MYCAANVPNHVAIVLTEIHAIIFRNYFHTAGGASGGAGGLLGDLAGVGGLLGSE